MMTSSFYHDNTFSLTVDIDSVSDSRMSNATDLQNVAIAGEGPDVPT